MLCHKWLYKQIDFWMEIYYISQNGVHTLCVKIQLVEGNIKLRKTVKIIGGGGSFIQKLDFPSFPKTEISYHGKYKNTPRVLRCNTCKPNKNSPVKVTFGVLMKYLKNQINTYHVRS